MFVSLVLQGEPWCMPERCRNESQRWCARALVRAVPVLSTSNPPEGCRSPTSLSRTPRQAPHRDHGVGGGAIPAPWRHGVSHKYPPAPWVLSGVHSWASHGCSQETGRAGRAQGMGVLVQPSSAHWGWRAPVGVTGLPVGQTSRDCAGGNRTGCPQA